MVSQNEFDVLDLNNNTCAMISNIATIDNAKLNTIILKVNLACKHVIERI